MNLIGRVCCAVVGTTLVIFQSRSWGKTSQVRRRHHLGGLDSRVNSLLADNDRPLEFVHISMTGGEAVERAGFQGAGLRWGSCHVKENEDIGCRKPDWHIEWIAGGQEKGSQDRKFDGEPEHAPPQWMSPNPYEGKDLFTVIRNPYDRIVDEYNTYAGPINRERSSVKMNKWIQAHLQYILDYDYFPGHFIPQHVYIFDGHRNQLIRHVLRYENLREEFGALMDRKGIPQVHLPRQEVVYNEFAKEQLSARNIRMINKIYAEDFQLLNYPMVRDPSQFASPFVRAAKNRKYR